jgi:predicted transcriptional regulator
MSHTQISWSLDKDRELVSEKLWKLSVKENRYLPMVTPQIKSEIIRAIEDLPDDATVEDAMERLYFLAKIERGLEQSESGETISHAEIKAKF